MFQVISESRLHGIHNLCSVFIFAHITNCCAPAASSQVGPSSTSRHAPELPNAPFIHFPPSRSPHVDLISFLLPLLDTECIVAPTTSSQAGFSQRSVSQPGILHVLCSLAASQQDMASEGHEVQTLNRALITCNYCCKRCKAVTGCRHIHTVTCAPAPGFVRSTLNHANTCARLQLSATLHELLAHP